MECALSYAQVSRYLSARELACDVLMEIETARYLVNGLMELTTSRKKNAGDPSISGIWRRIVTRGTCVVA